LCFICAEIPSLAPLPSEKLLVLVNPFSGPGKAQQLFQQHAAPIFAEAGLQYKLIVTGKGLLKFIYCD
jgi:sphingosine kinase